MKKVPISCLLLLSGIFFAACSKNTCPDYWQYPDCHTAERERFYGKYKGVSTLDNGSVVITQWQMQAGPEISELSMAPDLTVQLNAQDPRMFTFKDRSFMGNNRYIRSEGSSGFFNGDSVRMEFWMDEGKSVQPNEKLIHYRFDGVRH